jgi:hypothetical protein
MVGGRLRVSSVAGNQSLVVKAVGGTWSGKLMQNGT